MGPFSGDAVLLHQPSLDDVGSVLCFPLFQSFVVPTFGLDHFTGIRVFVYLEFAWFACAGCGSGRLASASGLRIEQVDDVFQAETIMLKQLAQFRFEFDFFLQFVITFQYFQCLELLGEVFFQLTVFCEFGHVISPVQ